MFTGIVIGTGTVVAVEPRGEAARITVGGLDLAGVSLGDSIAVDGVCLTAAETNDEGFVADLLPETRRRTSLGDVTVGRRVNLETAATPTTVLGGHLMQGHVDGVGTVVSRAPGAAWDDVVVVVPSGLTRYVVEKGSIALDGVSLTVVSVDGDEVAVSLIPETLARTTWGERQIGAAINVEVDVLAKYVERLLVHRDGAHREGWRP
jgi:riboflavin synthase